MNNINYMKENYIIPTILFTLIGIFGYLFIQEQEKYKVQKVIEKIGVTDMDLMKDGKTIIWAGLTGEFPKFISSGPLKGLGHGEYAAYRIKEKLKNTYGIRILERYVTPARLELEFRQHKYPICSFPYIWSNPAAEFAKDPKFLYSIGLDFSGDKKLQIIFPKIHAPLFEKHLDTMGNIKIESLLEDKMIKGTFINDVDYGPSVNKIILRKDNGDPYIHPKYKKHIKLMVATNNRQLLQMMKGTRFHYTFAQLITNDHYKMAKIDPKEFQTLTYYQERVQSVRDTNLQTLSIRCNLSKVSYKLMPVLNDIIKEIRGENHKALIEKMHEKIEFGYSNKMQTWDYFQGRFRSEIHSQEIDWWYNSLYLKHFQSFNFSKLPKKEISSIKINQHEILEKKTRDFQTSLWVKNHTAYYLKENQLSQIAQIQPYMHEAYPRSHYPLRQLDIGFLLNENERQDIINILNTNIEHDESEIHSLVINAFSMDLVEFKKILQNYKNLENVKVFFPSVAQSDFLLSWLPSKLRALSIVGAKIKSKKLKIKSGLQELDLSQTLIDKKILLTLLKNNHLTLNKLYLTNQRIIIDSKFIQEFNKLSWPSLKQLSLVNCMMNSNNATLFSQQIPDQLEELKLHGNTMSALNIQNIVKRTKLLKKLTISTPWIKSAFASRNFDLILPSNLETLLIENANIENEQLQNIHFPRTLKHLNLALNKINDIGLKTLESKLKNIQLETLILGGNNSTNQGIQNLFFSDKNNTWVKTLQNLKIPKSRIDCSFIKKLVLKNSQIRQFDISENYLNDDCIPYFFKLKNINTLDISSNLFSSKGLEILLKGMKKTIIHLGISNMLSLNAKKIATIIPPKLESLNLSSNYLESSEIIHILNHLPKNLKVLNIINNKIDQLSLHILEKKMPVQLQELNISDINTTPKEFKNFIEGLPNDLQSLEIEKFNCSESMDLQPSSFPNTIDFFITSHLQLQNDCAINLMANMPKHILRIWMMGAIIPLQAAQKFAERIKESNIASIQLSIEKTKIPYEKNYIKNLQNFLTTLPESLNVLSLWGTPIDTLFDVMENKNLRQLIFYGNYGSQPAYRINYKQSYLSQSFLKMILLGGENYNDFFAHELAKRNIIELLHLSLASSNITQEGLFSIIDTIGGNFHTLDIQSSKIQSQYIDLLLNKLTAPIYNINMLGNKIGEDGIKKINQWKIEKEKIIGNTIEILN